MVKLAFLWWLLFGSRFSESYLLSSVDFSVGKIYGGSRKFSAGEASYEFPSKPFRIKKIETKLLCNYHFNENNPVLIKEKIEGLINITRVKENFVPTSILVGLSGYIANKDFLFIPQFWAAFSIIHIITTTSMVINDLFDIETDSINHPERPLIKGTVTQDEAEIMTTILLMLVPIIGSLYLPVNAAPFWFLASWIIFLYTPILKRWFLIKNLTCALVVSATVPFVALSVNGLPTDMLVTLTSQTIFMASMYIELLLDITDIKGDRENGINTVPVVWGENATIVMVTSIVTVGFTNMLIELSSNNVPVNMIVGIILSYSPFYVNLLRIIRTQCSPLVIKSAVKQTTFSLLIYFATILFM